MFYPGYYYTSNITGKINKLLKNTKVDNKQAKEIMNLLGVYDERKNIVKYVKHDFKTYTLFKKEAIDDMFMKIPDKIREKAYSVLNNEEQQKIETQQPKKEKRNTKEIEMPPFRIVPFPKKDYTKEIEMKRASDELLLGDDISYADYNRLFNN